MTNNYKIVQNFKSQLTGIHSADIKTLLEKKVILLAFFK